MPRNLRSVIERVTRGGRSVVSRRNFSSCPNRGNVSEGSGDSVAYSVVRLLYLAAGYGFGNYYLGEEKDKEIDEYRQKVLYANKEEIYDIKTNQCTRLCLKVKKIHNEVRDLSCKGNELTSKLNDLTSQVDELKPKSKQ